MKFYCQQCLEPFHSEHTERLCQPCRDADQLKMDADYEMMRSQERLAEARHILQGFKEDGLIK